MNIALIIDMAATAFGARLAVTEDAASRSYADLLERVQIRAAGIRAIQGRIGAQHLAYIGLSGTDFIEHLLASAWAGIAFLPLNYRSRPEELAERLEAFHPVVLVHGPSYGDKARACAAEGDLLLDVEETLAAGIGQPPVPMAMDGDAVAVVLHTSGTTSRPKAVLLRQRHLCSYVFSTVELGSAAADEAALVSVPPYHIAGIMGQLTPLYAGRQLVALPRFDPEAWCEMARRQGVTHAFVVPTMLARILEVLEAQPERMPGSLRHLAYGGGPIHRVVVERALKLLPNVDFVNAYGLTETSSTVALLTPQDHRAAIASDDPAIRARLGSVGRPVPGVTIRIVDEAGVEVSRGSTGRICITGPQVSAEHLDASRAAGVLVTGDLGHIDGDGYLFIGARSDDVIIRGGENISPGEIEEVLARHPAVRSVAVVGLPDEEWGQRIVAVVEVLTGSDPQESELSEWCRHRLPGFKVPAAIVVSTELPRTDTGKVLRTRLREQLAPPQRIEA